MGQPLLLLLLVHTYIPASWGLRCLECKNRKFCSVEECAPGQDLCRTTVLLWEGSNGLSVVEKGCTYPEKTNRSKSYLIGDHIFTYSEDVCRSDLCNTPNSAPDANVPRNRYLECGSCFSIGYSFERAEDQSMHCHNSGDQCLDVAKQYNLKENPRVELLMRGCGIHPGCPGPTGFHNNHTFYFLRCCNTPKCNVGSVLELENLPPNGLQCYSCEGNSTHGCSSDETSLADCRGPMNRCLEATGTAELRNLSYTIRGCAAPSWCQSLHVAEAFDLTHVNVSCCTGNGCNHPDGEAQPRSGGAPQPSPAHLSFIVSLLLIARLWGTTLQILLTKGSNPGPQHPGQSLYHLNH